MNYTIVGNSAAAIGAVEGIRKYDSQGDIVIIGDENYPAYSRPMISHLLAGDIQEEQLNFRSSSFYESSRIKLLTGNSVTAVDSVRHQLVLANGRKMNYGRLLLAVGGRPELINLPGGEKCNVFNFLTRQDTEKINRSLDGSSIAVVLGAGLIALKAAEALCRRGAEVTVIVRSRLLRRNLDAEGAEIVRRYLEGKGINFVLGSEASRLSGEGRNAVLILEDGRKVFCPLLVLAAGVAPSTGLAETAGVNCSRGILVNNQMMTSVPDIYAAGDCACLPQLLGGEPRVTPVWPVAFASGKKAGAVMAGKVEPFDGVLAFNSLPLFGLSIITAGIIEGEGVESIPVKRGVYQRLFIREGRLVGYISIGTPDREGILTFLIRKRILVAPFLDRLTGLDFGWFDLPGQIQREYLNSGGGIIGNA